MAARAFITGLAGLEVSANERAFLREAQPWGLIIFKRNVSTPAQVYALVRSFRVILGWEAPVLVDQEGGPSRCTRPPSWSTKTGASRPTASRNNLIRSVTCAGVFTFLLKMIKPQGWASRTKARSLAAKVSPAKPVINARAAIGVGISPRLRSGQAFGR